ncbi:hypothetical protein CTA2_10894 [Colletotrichum tanaceti]|nr:hypothetical protein CTA2_10894 [Colletotrichum tanaceti]
MVNPSDPTQRPLVAAGPSIAPHLLPVSLDFTQYVDSATWGSVDDARHMEKLLDDTTDRMRRHRLMSTNRDVSPAASKKSAHETRRSRRSTRFSMADQGDLEDIYSGDDDAYHEKEHQDPDLQPQNAARKTSWASKPAPAITSHRQADNYQSGIPNNDGNDDRRPLWTAAEHQAYDDDDRQLPPGAIGALACLYSDDSMKYGGDMYDVLDMKLVIFKLLLQAWHHPTLLFNCFLFDASGRGFRFLLWSHFQRKQDFRTHDF